MALLMRRLLVDAHEKLRRMVEEHSANLAARIDCDYPLAASAATPASVGGGGGGAATTTPAFQPPPSTQQQREAALFNELARCHEEGSVDKEPPPSATAANTTTPPGAVTESNTRCSPPNKPTSLETAKRSKSLGNATNSTGVASSGVAEDGDQAKDSIKKCKSFPLKATDEVPPVEGIVVAAVPPPPPPRPPPPGGGGSGGETTPDSNQQVRKDKPTEPVSVVSTETTVLPPPVAAAPLPNAGNNGGLPLLPSPAGFSGTSQTGGTNNTSALRRMRLENDRLQAEITRLRRLVVSGASSVIASDKLAAESGADAAPTDSTGRVRALETELQLTKEAVCALKADRKRLKAEKFDLLNQMKQLYATLEDKEKELRDFIRNYEQRVRENETSLQQLSNEREERERERWSLLRHARDEAERSLSLAAQLNAKELQLQQAHEHLQEVSVGVGVTSTDEQRHQHSLRGVLQARRQLASSGCVSDQESLISLSRHTTNGGGGGAITPGSSSLGGLLAGIGGGGSHGHTALGGLLAGDRGSCSADSGVRVSSDRESGTTSIGGNLSDSTTDGTPTITIEGGGGGVGGGKHIEVDSVSLVSSIPPPHMYQTVVTPKDCSPTLSPLNANSFSRSIDSGALSRSVEQLNSPVDVGEPPILSGLGRRAKSAATSRLGSSGRGGTWGSISRVFARSRHRNKSSSLQESDNNYDPYRSWSPLTEEGYAEKLRLLREASTVPMERWRAPTVLAWLEVALGMPQYGARCAENIKSGKVLLELSDVELECGLGIAHPMHRKKLRLAIEEHRHPALVRYPCIAQLGHTWVSSEWLPDLGLSQYSDSFATNLVDARMLEHLSKKELEKFLGVTRKFHQASVVHGIHLLRIMKYDRQALAVRRHQCENVDADPLVWTNQRFVRWARNIDLGEYADNLKDSGVHGGLVVLEPSFNGDTMATALGIPASKNIIRRHLTAELEALVLPARSTLEHYVRVRARSRVPGGSLGRSFSRSCASGLSASSTEHISGSGGGGGRFGGGESAASDSSRRQSIRGSLSRAFGFARGSRSGGDHHIHHAAQSAMPLSDKRSPTSHSSGGGGGGSGSSPSPSSSSATSQVATSPLPPPAFRNHHHHHHHGSRSVHSGGESPDYAVPFFYLPSSSSSLAHCDSSSVYGYARSTSSSSARLSTLDEPRTREDYYYYHHPQTASATSKERARMSNPVAGDTSGSLHRNKRQHRRVRSISDIDTASSSAAAATHVTPL